MLLWQKFGFTILKKIYKYFIKRRKLSSNIYYSAIIKPNHLFIGALYEYLSLCAIDALLY